MDIRIGVFGAENIQRKRKISVINPLAGLPAISKKIQSIKKEGEGQLSETLLKKFVQAFPQLGSLFNQNPQLVGLFDQTKTRQEKVDLVNSVLRNVNIPRQTEDILSSVAEDFDTDFTMQRPIKISQGDKNTLQIVNTLFGNFSLEEAIADLKALGYNEREMLEAPQIVNARRIMRQSGMSNALIERVFNVLITPTPESQLAITTAVQGDTRPTLEIAPIIEGEAPALAPEPAPAPPSFIPFSGEGRRLPAPTQAPAPEPAPEPEPTEPMRTPEAEEFASPPPRPADIPLPLTPIGEQVSSPVPGVPRAPLPHTVSGAKSILEASSEMRDLYPPLDILGIGRRQPEMTGFVRDEFPVDVPSMVAIESSRTQRREGAPTEPMEPGREEGKPVSFWVPQELRGPDFESSRILEERPIRPLTFESQQRGHMARFLEEEFPPLPPMPPPEPRLEIDDKGRIHPSNLSLIDIKTELGKINEDIKIMETQYGDPKSSRFPPEFLGKYRDLEERKDLLEGEITGREAEIEEHKRKIIGLQENLFLGGKGEEEKQIIREFIKESENRIKLSTEGFRPEVISRMEEERDIEMERLRKESEKILEETKRKLISMDKMIVKEIDKKKKEVEDKKMMLEKQEMREIKEEKKTEEEAEELEKLPTKTWFNKVFSDKNVIREPEQVAKEKLKKLEKEMKDKGITSPFARSVVRNIANIKGINSRHVFKESAFFTRKEMQELKPEELNYIRGLIEPLRVDYDERKIDEDAKRKERNRLRRLQIAQEERELQRTIKEEEKRLLKEAQKLERAEQKRIEQEEKKKLEAIIKAQEEAIRESTPPPPPPKRGKKKETPPPPPPKKESPPPPPPKRGKKKETPPPPPPQKESPPPPPPKKGKKK